jgi:hypothetical protein
VSKKKKVELFCSREIVYHLEFLWYFHFYFVDYSSISVRLSFFTSRSFHFGRLRLFHNFYYYAFCLCFMPLFECDFINYRNSIVFLEYSVYKSSEAIFSLIIMMINSTIYLFLDLRRYLLIKFIMRKVVHRDILFS